MHRSQNVIAVFAAIVLVPLTIGTLPHALSQPWHAPGRGARIPPYQQHLNLWNGVFLRDSIAFLRSAGDMVEYPAGAPRVLTVASCSASDGEILYDVGTGGAADHLYPWCSDGQYVYATSAHHSGVYRSADGNTWERVHGAHFCGMVRLAVSDILVALAFQGPARDLYWSDDQGESWTRCQDDAGNEFRFGSENGGLIRSWNFHESPTGTALIGEYASGLQRYLYRTTDGQVWTQVYDLGADPPSTASSQHYHKICYHAATGRWIAFTGDGANKMVLYSDDDGLSGTWNQFGGGRNRFNMQPTAAVDYGDATMLLTGADSSRDSIYRTDVFDLSIEPVWNGGDLRPNRCNIFEMFEHDGVYYACTAYNQTGPCAILASADTEHWAVYHEFAADELIWMAGVFAGEVDGKLYFLLYTTDDGSSPHRGFRISPARVVNRTALLLEPGTSNLASAVTSSAEADTPALAGWIESGGGAPDETFETVTSPVLHGDWALHYESETASNVTLRTSFAQGLDVDAKYQVRAWVRGAAGRVYPVGYYYDGADWAYPSFEWSWRYQPTDTWQEIVGPAMSFTNSLEALQIRWVGWRSSSYSMDWCLDAFQLEETPSTTWQVGGTPRADETLEHSVTVADGWTHLLTIQPGEMSRFYAGLTALYVRSWVKDADNYAVLYFDPTDNKFKLAYYEQTNRCPELQWTLATPAQSWAHRYPQINLAVSAGATSTRLGIRCGSSIAVVVQDEGMTALCETALTTRSGDQNGWDVIPHTAVDNCIYHEGLSDEELVHLMSLAALPFPGDLNCDGVVDVGDVNPFVRALSDPEGYVHTYPDCDILNADCNGDGAVDFGDINAFVQLLSGG